jgi:hypothetical protein
LECISRARAGLFAIAAAGKNKADAHLKHETFVIKLSTLRRNAAVYVACGSIAFYAMNCCVQNQFT